MAKKKLFLAQAAYEEQWLVWANDEDEALESYWTAGKQVVNDMRFFEMDEISPEDALKRFKEIPDND
jgi:hypothetical protein